MKYILSNIIAVVSTAMIFSSCGSQKNIYKWERDEIRPIADAAICYGGHSARNPYLWTEVQQLIHLSKFSRIFVRKKSHVYICDSRAVSFV